MMYASKNAYNQRWETSRITGCKFWLAHYTSQTDYKGKYHMWQYTSKGSVPGISGYVDMNIAYFKYSTEAPAKKEEPIKENTTTSDTKKDEEKPTITFKDQTDTVLTITNTPFYEDYNKDTNGNIEKDTKIERIGISNDNVWSKLKYNNKTIYVKTENLKLFVEEIIDPNENNDSE